MIYSNGYQLQLERDGLVDMFIGIADGKKDKTEAALDHTHIE